MTLPFIPTDFAAPVNRTLRRLFLTLFLRGRSARGLRKEKAPDSIGRKLLLTLVFYALFGTLSLTMAGSPTLMVSIYLHTMGLLFLAMFIASSSGELLFNKEEADILLFRPISPRQLLWAKVRVLVEVSVWIALSFNLAGFVTGMRASDGSPLFIPVHAASTILEALFCASGVVLLYQLCLRWFGREKLDSVMTTAQVLVTVAAVAGAQAVPWIMAATARLRTTGQIPWWSAFLPPVWFAGIDDALAGSHSLVALILGITAVLITGILMWAAFDRLAATYGQALQSIGESAPARPASAGRKRFLHRIVELPPLRWWLRDPVVRGSFLLTAAYLARDRDVKLRVFPSIAPMLIIPFFLLLERPGGRDSDSLFPQLFGPAYLALTPALALLTLQYSQQYQASDVFRLAPIVGPGPICAGARKAVLLLIAFPAIIAFAAVVWFVKRDVASLALLLPGLISTPLFALAPHRSGKAVPLSVAGDEARAAGRGLVLLVLMAVSGVISFAGWIAWQYGWFWPALAAEAILIGAATHFMDRRLARLPWRPLD